MNKNQEIASLQKKQKALKKEVFDTKKKLPKYIIGFLLLTFVSLYFLEDRFYNFFGNGVDIIIYGVVFSGIICLFFVIKSYIKIDKKKKESKVLGTKLYSIMKLSDSSKNE